ncbi:unnamed protein product [Nezara viridula]|uniref:Uncharacterized protein n=1 Tax=Nezara viridula TaxID=85310 RepID=A0A9P0HMC8_NEZVI|nr:unnamed protein product [Nezara viridula]
MVRPCCYIRRGKIGKSWKHRWEGRAQEEDQGRHEKAPPEKPLTEEGWKGERKGGWSKTKILGSCST